jgi:hypothetical protein
MSYSYTVTERKRKTTSSGGYGHSGNRSTLGYWLPLAFTVTAATIGLAAWVWSERKDDEDLDSSEDERWHQTTTTTVQGGGGGGGGIMAGGAAAAAAGAGYASMSGALPSQGPPPQGEMLPGPQQPGGFPGMPVGYQPVGPQQPGGFQSGPPPPGWQGTAEQYYASRSTAVETQQETGLVARMSSALGFGRSTTPQGQRAMDQTPGQGYDWANKPFASATAAAGAMVGAAMGALSGSGEQGYEDHERWSEEAEQRDSDRREVKQGIKRRGTADEFYSGSIEVPKVASISNRKRRTVAVVVSADGHAEGEVGDHAVSPLRTYSPPPY